MNGSPSFPENQVAELKDFSGGKTDFYLGADLNKFKDGDNILIKKQGEIGKIFSRPGSHIYDSTYYQIPVGAQRINTLKYFNSNLFFHSARKFYYINSAWITLQGPTSNEVFPSGVDTTTVASMAEWNGHLYVTNSDYSRLQKIYKDGTNVWRVRTAGMPDLASSPTVTAGGAGANSYLYRFLYYYTYTVGTVTYIDRGSTTEVSLVSALAPDASAVAISNIPALANGATHNYDTASTNLKIEIYRTTNGGVNFFYVGAVNNGTTTFNDSVSDGTLQTNEPLYTEGGIVDNDQPPLCKLVHVVGDVGYYADVKIGTETHTGRFYQSVPGDIDAVPGDFYGQVDDKIVGLSSVRNIPMLLCEGGGVYRVEGDLNELGQGSLFAQKISSTAGCVSSQSVVQTLEGIFWAGLDGFYFSDGYQVIRVSDGIRNSYKDLISTAERKRRIIGKYDATEKRIWWTVQSATSATEVDACYILDLNFGISKDMPFTTASGSDNFAPTAIEFIGSNLIRGDSRGYTFQHSNTVYNDPKVDVGLAPSSWQITPIIYTYTSVATDFGTSHIRKMVNSMSTVCRNQTNLSMAITSINDDGRKTGSLKPIRFRGNMTWGDADLFWGDASLIWNYLGIIDEFRRFPATNLRCQYKQIGLTNAKVAIISSDTLGTCSVNQVTKIATITDSGTFDWPTNAIDYYLAFENDGYDKEYIITARSADTLTFTDADNTCPNGTQEWVIRGYPKSEALDLISITLNYYLIGQTMLPYRSASTGEVGAAS